MSIFIKFLNFIELKIGYLQGKGWGGGTIEKEFASVSSPLSSNVDI